MRKRWLLLLAVLAGCGGGGEGGGQVATAPAPVVPLSTKLRSTLPSRPRMVSVVAFVSASRSEIRSPSAV